jgi:ribosomal-protein-alanine N-acetyltransferase
MPRTPPVLRTERLVLRLAEPHDVNATVRFFSTNREHLAPSRPRMEAEFFTPEFWRTQVYAARAEFDADRSLRLFLFERDQAEVVGSLNFTSFVRGAAHFCTVGYGLARDREGRGYMTEALRAAVAYVFGELNMHRIQANYVPRNERSGRVLRRLGFVVEGYARDYLFLDGRWEDHILTALTNPDWRGP